MPVKNSGKLLISANEVYVIGGVSLSLSFQMYWALE